MLLSTKANNGTYGGVTYQIDGELVPALTVELMQGQKYILSIYFVLYVL